MRTSTIFRAQGAYYAATGLWPLVSMRTFLRVTGPKHDLWLVRMVGALALTIGGTLLVAANADFEPATGRRRAAGDATSLTLAVAAALSFAAIDVVYTARRRISPIYLGDAVLEVACVAALACARIEPAGRAPLD